MSDERRLHIVIGVPCYRDVSAEVVEDWMRFAFHCGRRLPHYDFSLAIKTKSEQFRARNAIVDVAQAHGADYLLMLDDDMIVNPQVTSGPTDDYGFLERLIAHDKDLVGALYYQRSGSCAPVLMTKMGERGYRFLRDDELTGGLQRVDVAGGGCLLIKMRVFDYLKAPYFAPEYEYGTDVQLCRAAAEKGFEVWADTSVELGHVRSERVIITSRNKHQFLSETLPGEVRKHFVASDVYDRLVQDGLAYTGYADLDDITRHAQAFLLQMDKWKAGGGADADWYRQFPNERVARQIWFNTQSAHKRQMTEYILSAIPHHTPLDILDFGCGIGIPAFTLADKGHRVTALDIRGTGTLEFLKWRAKSHGVPITFHESDGGMPHLGGASFDFIIAMDCLEHIPEWRRVLAILADHLKVKGVLFSNNAILDDPGHPEHYDLNGKDFVRACVDLDLMPFNAITYEKRESRVLAAQGAA